METGHITEKKYGGNYSYILKKNTQFIPTDYKIMQHQTNIKLLKCMKMLFDGKIQLFYFTEGKKNLSNLVVVLTADEFVKIIKQIIQIILEVRNNGFLKTINLDLSFEHIYVDPNTLETGLIYLPADIHFFQNELSQEKVLRTELCSVIKKQKAFHTEKYNSFYEKLQDENIRLVELLGKRMQLVSMNLSAQIIFNVIKDNYVIGKKAELVDGVLNVNNMVSRTHCRINIVNDVFTITDLQSSNGTFLNNLRLISGVPHKLKHGDIIMIANCKFKVICI